MTRRELIERLTNLQVQGNADTYRRVNELVADIKADGVLDVQCPPDIAIWMDLPRPA